MPRRRIFKIVLLGDQGVGKATFRMRFLGHGFRQNYGKIIGANFSVKKINNYLAENIIAQIWEIIPQYRFRYIREVYYKGSIGGILVFDISRRETMESLHIWIQEFKKFNNGYHVPLLIVGSKADLREKSEGAISRSEAENFVESISQEIDQKVVYAETSILATDEIEQGFRVFVNNITNHLLFSNQAIDNEIDKFLKKHGKILKKDLYQFRSKDKEQRPVEEFTTPLQPILVKKLNQLAKTLGVEVSTLLNKIIADFFDK